MFLTDVLAKFPSATSFFFLDRSTTYILCKSYITLIIMIQRLVDSLHFGECDCCNGSFRLYTWENGSFCSKCLIDNGVFDEREERDFMCDFLHNFDSKLNVPTLSNVLSTIHHGKCLSCSSAWSRLYAWENGSFCAECLISSGAICGKNIDIIRKFDEK